MDRRHVGGLTGEGASLRKDRPPYGTMNATSTSSSSAAPFSSASLSALLHGSSADFAPPDASSYVGGGGGRFASGSRPVSTREAPARPPTDRSVRSDRPMANGRTAEHKMKMPKRPRGAEASGRTSAEEEEEEEESSVREATHHHHHQRRRGGSIERKGSMALSVAPSPALEKPSDGAVVHPKNALAAIQRAQEVLREEDLVIDQYTAFAQLLAAFNDEQDLDLNDETEWREGWEDDLREWKEESRRIAAREPDLWFFVTSLLATKNKELKRLRCKLAYVNTSHSSYKQRIAHKIKGLLDDNEQLKLRLGYHDDDGSRALDLPAYSKGDKKRRQYERLLDSIGALGHDGDNQGKSIELELRLRRAYDDLEQENQVLRERLCTKERENDALSKELTQVRAALLQAEAELQETTNKMEHMRRRIALLQKHTDGLEHSQEAATTTALRHANPAANGRGSTASKYTDEARRPYVSQYRPSRENGIDAAGSSHSNGARHYDYDSLPNRDGERRKETSTTQTAQEDLSRPEGANQERTTIGNATPKRDVVEDLRQRLATLSAMPPSPGPSTSLPSRQPTRASPTRTTASTSSGLPSDLPNLVTDDEEDGHRTERRRKESDTRVQPSEGGSRSRSGSKSSSSAQNVHGEATADEFDESTLRRDREVTQEVEGLLARLSSLRKNAAEMPSENGLPRSSLYDADRRKDAAPAPTSEDGVDTWLEGLMERQRQLRGELSRSRTVMEELRDARRASLPEKSAAVADKWSLQENDTLRKDESGEGQRFPNVRLSWSDRDDSDGEYDPAEREERHPSIAPARKVKAREDVGSDIDFGEEDDLDIGQLTLQFDKDLKERLSQHHIRP